MAARRMPRSLLALVVSLVGLAPRAGHPATVAAATLTFTVNSTADTPDANPGDGICADASGQCTLRAAIQEADAQTSGDSIAINVPAGTYGMTMGTLLLTANTITISGALSSTTTIQGNGVRPLSVFSGASATISGLTLTGGNAGSGGLGGGIYNTGTLTLNDCTISGNTTGFDGSGGGIYNAGTLTLNNSTLSGNSASSNSGGIYNYYGALNVTSSTITGNTPGGAGISNQGGRVSVTNSTISANSGGIDNYNSGLVNVTSSIITGNTAANGSGGGIDNGSGTMNVTSSTISNNMAPYNGGGIYNAGPLNVTSSTISTNTAANGSGGGIYNTGGRSVTMNVTSSTISNNTAPNGSGGGIDNLNSPLNVTSSTISNNTAPSGLGGGIDNDGGTLNATSSTISNNAAGGSGGGIYNNSGTATLLYDTIASNSDGIYSGSNLTLAGTIVANSTGLNCNGVFTDQGNNLDSGTLCGFNLITDITNTNPLLDSLANNGGPTQTMALLPGSLAIDHGGTGATGCPATDQRGQPRPDEAADKGACDIGAFEVQPGPAATNTPTSTPVPPTNTPTSTPTNTPTSTPTSTPTNTPTSTPSSTPTATPTTTRLPAMLVVSPTSGVYQQSITLTGTNFAPSEVVNIYADSTSTPPLYTPSTNAAGTFVLHTTVVQGTFGPHTLIAVGQTSGLSATAVFTYVPSLHLSPIMATAGTQIVASGYGFGASERVTTYWRSRRGIVLGITTTNALGTFAGPSAITFTVPMSPTGAYPIISVGQASGAVVTSTFTLLPSLRITPTRGRHGSTATVAGTGYGAHEQITVRWDCPTSTCSSTQVLGSKVTNGNGTFSGLSVTIPATATVGTYPVGGVGATSHAFTATYYTVTS